MTIAIGFTTRDAVVLCADSQETVSDYSKTTTQKIRTVTFFNNWRMAVVGSSDASQYIDLFEHEVGMRLANAGQDFDYARTVSIIKGTLHQIHKQYIWLRRENRPIIHLLIALQGINPHPSRALLVSYDGALYPVPSHEHFASVGVGTHMAKAIKDRLLPDAGMIYNSPAEVMANYGIYLLWHVKKSIVGCDGNTLALILQDGKFRWLTGEEVGEIEHAIQMLYPNQRQLLSALFNPSVDMQGVANLSNSFVGAMTALKGELIRGYNARKHLQDLFDNRVKAQKAPQSTTATKASEPKPSVSRKSKGQR